MKIKDGYLLRNVANNYIVVAVGEAGIDFNGIITINETGAMLWKFLEDGVSKDELVLKLTEEYEVSKEIAEADVDSFLNIMKEADLLDN